MRKIIFTVIVLLVTFSCKTSQNLSKTDSPTVISVQESKIDCFDAGLKSDTSLIYCETSAVLFHQGRLYLASDKSFGKIPSFYPVWTLPYQKPFDKQRRTDFQAPAFKKGEKYEDFTITPDNKFILLTTAFDRYKNDKSWDNFNTILAWETGKKSQPFVISADNQASSSVEIRAGLQKALVSEKFPEGSPYFKIEGLAALPENKLLFGVREIGKSFANPEFVIKFIQVSYQINPTGKLVLQNDFKLIYDFKIQNLPELTQPLGLSSIEFNQFDKKIYLLTSYELGEKETDKKLGAYLWTLTLDDLKTQKSPTLVRKTDGTVLQFSHKYEDLTFIDKNTIFLIADEDRVKPEISGKNPNQTWYCILKMK